MFLLILNFGWKAIRVKNFTFHNVSINTAFLMRFCERSFVFTFHNVSINTCIPDCPSHHMVIFTFHNVSINTPCSTFTYNTSFILPFSVDLVIYNYFIHKIDIITLYKASIFLINKGFVNLPGFFPYRRLTITE